MSWVSDILAPISILAVLSAAIAAVVAIFIRSRFEKKQAELLRKLALNDEVRIKLRRSMAELSASRSILDDPNLTMTHSQLDILKQGIQRLRQFLAELERSAERVKAELKSANGDELRKDLSQKMNDWIGDSEVINADLTRLSDILDEQVRRIAASQRT